MLARTAFDWIAALSDWQACPQGEQLDLPLEAFVHRSHVAGQDWAFAFVSWASDRLIRTGEWYEIQTCTSPDGLQQVRIVRERPPHA
ncbi:hypothetical protein [Luteimonas sp. TWI1416]|uniref:hypothetical protein n=1 Tax=unclassified Luteimonas TaxID=2629088 RepID=UPI00320A1E6B